MYKFKPGRSPDRRKWNGEGVPQWIKNEDQYMRIKNEIKLLEYQVRCFNREINFQKKKYDSLVAGQESRKESYGLKYNSRKAIDEAYLIGAIDDTEYRKQRAALWYVYSDRGYIARLEWLNKERDKAQAKLDRINEWRKQAKAETVKRYERGKHARMMERNRKRRIRREEYRRRDKERWQKYGIG